jgi:hypothetical protein
VPTKRTKMAINCLYDDYDDDDNKNDDDYYYHHHNDHSV